MYKKVLASLGLISVMLFFGCSSENGKPFKGESLLDMQKDIDKCYGHSMKLLMDGEKQKMEKNEEKCEALEAKLAVEVKNTPINGNELSHYIRLAETGKSLYEIINGEDIVVQWKIKVLDKDNIPYFDNARFRVGSPDNIKTPLIQASFSNITMSEKEYIQKLEVGNTILVKGLLTASEKEGIQIKYASLDPEIFVKLFLKDLMYLGQDLVYASIMQDGDGSITTDITNEDIRFPSDLKSVTVLKTSTCAKVNEVIPAMVASGEKFDIYCRNIGIGPMFWYATKGAIIVEADVAKYHNASLLDYEMKLK